MFFVKNDVPTAVQQQKRLKTQGTPLSFLISESGQLNEASRRS